MYLRELVIENDGPIKNLHINFESNTSGQPLPYIFVGRNGSGKTNLLSVISDALIECSTVAYNDVVEQAKVGRNYFRILGGKTIRYGEKYSICALRFEHAGSDLLFFEKVGDLTIEDARGVLPETFVLETAWQQEEPFKNFHVDKNVAENIHSEGVYAFFPASRSEYPHWLNRSSIKTDSFDVADRFTGQLGKPLFVERGIDSFSQWLLGAITDSRLELMYALLDPVTASMRDIQAAPINPSQLMPFYWANQILRIIMNDESAQFIWAGRNDARKVRVALGGELLAAGLDSLSGGQASLLALFGTILRYADSMGRDPHNVQGIVVIDEIDAHMHVGLQTEVLPRLIQLFQGIQFIVSSHSPLFALGMERTFTAAGVRIVELPEGAYVDAEIYEEFQKAFDALKDTKSFTSAVTELARSNTAPLIMLGGETDLKYFQAAARALGYGQLADMFRWIGSVGETGTAANSGDGALRSAVKFLKDNPEFLRNNIVFVYDCDALVAAESHGLLHVLALERDPEARATKGIENLLPDFVFKTDFYRKSEKPGDYGEKNVIEKLDKMALCKSLCEDNPIPENFIKFRPILDKLTSIVSPVALPASP